MADHFRPSLLYSAPSRLSSEAPPHREKDPNKRKHHLHRHHHHHRSSRHHAKEIVQSAFPSQPPTSFGDLLKQAKESISSSPADSRRASVAVTDGAADKTGQADVSGGLDVPPLRRLGRPEDLVREQRRVELREDALRSSLQTLNEQSMKTSRRLDDTYYSLLERVATCRQTIGSLQELSNLANELHHNFEADTQELAEDVEGQFEGFNNFETQQGQVAALERRIQAGKEKAEALNGRLADARSRVDKRMKLEAELELRNTRHVRILWGIIGALLSLVLLSILFQQLRPVHPDTGHTHALDFASREQILNAPIPDMAKEAIMRPNKAKEQLDVRIESPSARAEAGVPEDDRLRVFDEL
ncbi:hypothetical protein DPSP01_008258 [Paraphaeosphaeria sporulosa]|uniref:Uncharacterized protein n=1 Tax=Paraphaeosphaeria sporulosa TaxID=1460663 RepID=A0A177BUG7_9PLEO|nr:uncharacterized protein CC84DRAFT_1169790 [Paraphaeosphaeria sporulosa]OAF99092.1 hypothetical protein CC84DRAFT_1169790 [Paraphaeosphaeria sporulosa]